MSVGLVYSVVSKIPFTFNTVTSRKCIEVVEYSYVNFIDGCILFSDDMKAINVSSPCIQMENISSINLQYTKGFRGLLSIACVSKLSMKIDEKVGEQRDPIEHPLTCRYCSSLNLKLFRFKMSSRKSTRTSVGGSLTHLFSRAVFTAVIPSLCGMFV